MEQTPLVITVICYPTIQVVLKWFVHGSSLRILESSLRIQILSLLDSSFQEHVRMFKEMIKGKKSGMFALQHSWIRGHFYNLNLRSGIKMRMTCWIIMSSSFWRCRIEMIRLDNAMLLVCQNWPACARHTEKQITISGHIVIKTMTINSSLK